MTTSDNAQIREPDDRSDPSNPSDLVVSDLPIRPENRARYPANWRDISTRIRAGRAHWRCECDGRCGSRSCPGTPEQRCKAIDGQPSPTSGKTVILTVAHLDHSPENCDPDNLLAMCQRCHLAYDRDHHAETFRATRAAQLAAQMDPLFPTTEEVPAR